MGKLINLATQKISFYGYLATVFFDEISVASIKKRVSIQSPLNTLNTQKNISRVFGVFRGLYSYRRGVLWN